MKGSKTLKSIFILAILVYTVIQAFKGGDFQIYMGAAELLKLGKNCYNVWIPLTGGNAGSYSYSPVFAMALIPFTFLPFPAAQIIWLLACLFFLYRIFKITTYYLDTSLFTSRQYQLWVLISVLLILRFLLNNFEMVQVTIFLVYCCMESLYQLQKGESLKSGLLLSLGIIVKIIPIIMIPYFLYRKEYKTTIIAVLGFIFFLLFPALIYGWEFNTLLITNWIEIINPTNTEFIMNQNVNGEGVHSLSALFSGYFSSAATREGFPFSRVLIELDASSIVKILNIARCLLIVFTLYFLQTLPFVKFKSNHHTFWEFSYILCITPLIFPHQQKYAFFLLMPSVVYISYFLIVTYRNKSLTKFKFRTSIAFLLVFFILSTLTTDGIIGNRLNDLSEYYKTITIGCFFLIPLLASCHPKQMILDSKNE